MLAPITYFWIPNRIDEAWFLNKEQKRLAAIRYEINKAHYNQKEQFQWSEVLRGLTDWKVSCSCEAKLTRRPTSPAPSSFARM